MQNQGMVAAFYAAGTTVSPCDETQIPGEGRIESGEHPGTESEQEAHAPEVKPLRKPDLVNSETLQTFLLVPIS